MFDSNIKANYLNSRTKYLESIMNQILKLCGFNNKNTVNFYNMMNLFLILRISKSHFIHHSFILKEEAKSFKISTMSVFEISSNSRVLCSFLVSIIDLQNSLWGLHSCLLGIFWTWNGRSDWMQMLFFVKWSPVQQHFDFLLFGMLLVLNPFMWGYFFGFLILSNLIKNFSAIVRFVMKAK